jgi:hypothetical protein
MKRRRRKLLLPTLFFVEGFVLSSRCPFDVIHLEIRTWPDDLNGWAWLIRSQAKERAFFRITTEQRLLEETARLRMTNKSNV